MSGVLKLFTLSLVVVAAMGACAADAPKAPKAPAAASASLKGARWVGVVDPSLDKDSVPWLEFVSDTRVSGYTGCNIVSGLWRSEGGEIRFANLVMTKRACLGPGGEMEKRFSAALNEQGRAARDGAKLVVTGAGGERLEFQRAAAN